jgi:hypothetical protein
MNNTLTRLAGYKASRGKEAQSQEIFLDFCDNYGLVAEEITGYENNRTMGDWTIGNRNIEVKSQNIGQYPANFFELGEITTKDYHSTGWDKLVDLMNMNGVNMERYGNHPFFNFGFTPATNGATVVYVNRNTNLIYIYSAKTLIDMVAKAIATKGIQIGLGKANKDTVSCFIPNSKVSFQKVNNEWVYNGAPELDVVLKALGK